MLNVAWAITDPGLKRENNEDCFYFNEKCGVFLVADGVGGGDDGELASKMIAEGLEAAAESLSTFASTDDPINNHKHREMVFAKLLGVIQDINHAVYEAGREKNTYAPMASTCEAILITGAAAFIAHVGDSRIYLIREDEIYRITEDHTFAEELRAKNVINEKMLAKYQHVLSRSIGGKPKVEIDSIFIDLQDGDRLFMCSDGITDYLSGPEINDFCREFDEDLLLQNLVDSAKERGGSDNLTGLLVRVHDDDLSRDTIRDMPRFDTMRQADLLGKVSVFRGLDIRQILKVMRIVGQETFQKGDVIFSEGDVLDSLYIVADGEVELQVGDLPVGAVPTGSHFGELALVTDDPSSFSAKCKSNVRVLTISETRFRQIVASESEVGARLLWNLLKSSAREISRLSTEVARAKNA